jgi:hypothetical protein
VSEIHAALADVALDWLAHLLGDMRAAGIADPARVVRQAVAAGEEGWRWPLIALARGADPLAVLWAGDVRVVLGVITVPGPPDAAAHAVSTALDILALGRELAAR